MRGQPAPAQSTPRGGELTWQDPTKLTLSSPLTGRFDLSANLPTPGQPGHHLCANARSRDIRAPPETQSLWAATQLYAHTIYPAVREGSVQPGGLEAAAKFGYEADRMA